MMRMANSFIRRQANFIILAGSDPLRFRLASTSIYDCKIIRASSVASHFIYLFFYQNSSFYCLKSCFLEKDGHLTTRKLMKDTDHGVEQSKGGMYELLCLNLTFYKLKLT